MRLFIAIQFDEPQKDKLMLAQSELKTLCAKGNFTRRENLHLSLAFLGETAPSRVASLRQAMDGVTLSAFTLHLENMGCFRQKRGDVWWVGVDGAKNLALLHQQIFQCLEKAGFPTEKRRFNPHLTLAREVQLQNATDIAALANRAEPILAQASALSLMESSRLDGRLTYTELYAKPLLRAEEKP